MSAPATTTKRKMGVVTLLSFIILVATFVWAFYTFILVQFGLVRTYDPHIDYEDVEDWPYDIPWAGGRSNWFENINYTDIPLDQDLPEDLLEQMDNVVFIVQPEDPPQLWRSSAYDSYDGSGWGKTLGSPISATSEIIDRSQAITQGNTIYRVYMNMTAGPNTDSIELPTLFPEIQVIRDSFETGYTDDQGYHTDVPSRLLSYDLETDEYGTLLFSPFIEGTTGETVLVSYEITFANQDLPNIAANALPGSAAPVEISSIYSSLDFTPTQLVVDNYSQFIDVGTSAYDKALAVDQYFRSTFRLMAGQDEYMERPGSGEEVTDWFLRRCGGLPMDFATAYCVYMRGLNIPARMAIGYAVGDPGGGYRTLRVRHMMFWAEVFIPMSGSPAGGEWIQVIPIPLPGDMGGDEIPENTPAGSLELLVWPNLSQGWVMIGQPFTLSALLLLDQSPIGAPYDILFIDITDGVVMGTAQIEMGSFLPLANLTYAFPADASAGLHNITATFQLSTPPVSNWTAVYAVATPEPLNMERSNGMPEFSLSDEVDLNIKLGWDNYTAYWDDQIHVHGVMTSGGQPVNGSELQNDQMQIMWDNGWYGNATIGEDGYYELYIDADPTDLSRMKLGQHEVWAWYLGEWQDSIPIYLPARSDDNSTVELRGWANLSLTVIPGIAYRGSNIYYDGIASLPNGTILVSEDIDIILDGAVLTTVQTNSSGGFNFTYQIPTDYSIGLVYANVSWTSTINLVRNSESAQIPVDIVIGGTSLTIDMTSIVPDVAHILENVTFYGNLTDAGNGTGLPGRTIDVWWDWGNGTIDNLGPVTTGAGGYYEIANHTVPAGFEGFADVWAEYDSLDPNYSSSNSSTLSIEVKKWDVQITIQVDPDPTYLLQTVQIQGIILLPEIFAGIQNAHLTIWWDNSTGPHNITGIYTNTTGGYSFNYQVPATHELAIIGVYVNFSSPSPAFESAESIHEPLDIQTLPTIISVSSNSTAYYLNETAHISGSLRFGNGTPITGQTVYIHWDNGTFPVPVYQKITDGTGNYDFYYNLTTNDAVGPVDVYVNFTSFNPLYDNATNTLVPMITLRLYDFTLSTYTNGTQFHLDDIIEFSGTLTFNEGGGPAIGQIITIYYQNNTGTYQWTKVSNSTGGFRFLYNASTNDLLGAIYLWARYNSTNPLWDNATSVSIQVDFILYAFTLSISTDAGSYFLDEIVHVSGVLRYQHNNTPRSGGQIRVYWDNGTVYQFQWYATDGTGTFDFYYTCSVPKDSVGSVTIWAEFINFNPLWDNTTSTTTNIWLDRYAFDLTINTNSTFYYLNETVHVSGVLTYQNNASPRSGQQIWVYWDNGTTYLGSGGLTDGTGTFNFYYDFSVTNDLPGSIAIWAEFVNINPLWYNCTSPSTGITVDRWPTTISIASPLFGSTYYLSETMMISGTLYYDLMPLQSFANQIVEIFDNGMSIDTAVTASDGSFNYAWVIPVDTPTGSHDIEIRYQSGVNWIADTQAFVFSVNIQEIPVTLTIIASPQAVYRNDVVSFTGLLTFENGTLMVGYDVEIWWGTSLLDTKTTDGSGVFTHTYLISWTHPVGLADYYAIFVRPSNAFEQEQTSTQNVEVWDLVDLSLDTQTVTAVRRGDNLIVSGTVTNGAGDVQGVRVGPILNGTSIPFEDTTGTDGTFSISVDVPSDAAPGMYLVSVQVLSQYYNVSLPLPTPWTVTVTIGSVVSIQFVQDAAFQGGRMPGESFGIDVQIRDEDGNLLPVATLTFFLGSTELETRNLIGSDWSNLRLTVPSTGISTGFYKVRVEYAGSTYYDSSSDESEESLHVFTSVSFDFSGTPSAVTPAQQILMSCNLTDNLGNPIAFRPVILNLNGSNPVNLITDRNGGIAHSIGQQEEGSLRLTVTLTSGEVSNVQDTFTVLIQESGGGLLQGLDLLLPAVAIVAAIIVVILYLYFVRGMFRPAIKVAGVDVPSKLRNIKKLADSGKYGAAITLAYRTFEQMCGSKTSQERQHYETAREYVERILKVIPLDSASVEEFVQAYEEARFSHHKMNKKRYELAIKTFTDLYPRIESTTPTA